jgi:hypothetical protein
MPPAPSWPSLVEVLCVPLEPPMAGDTQKGHAFSPKQPLPPTPPQPSPLFSQPNSRSLPPPPPPFPLPQASRSCDCLALCISPRFIPSAPRQMMRGAVAAALALASRLHAQTDAPPPPPAVCDPFAIDDHPAGSTLSMRGVTGLLLGLSQRCAKPPHSCFKGEVWRKCK